MSKSIHSVVEEKVKEFQKQYPINYGNPYPHFVDGTPVATHIVQWIERTLTDLLSKERSGIEEKIKALSKDWKDAGNYDAYNAAEYIIDFIQSNN